MLRPVDEIAFRYAAGEAGAGEPFAALGGFFQKHVTLPKIAGIGRAERNDLLSGKVMCLYEMVYNVRRFAPPDRIAQEDRLIRVPRWNITVDFRQEALVFVLTAHAACVVIVVEVFWRIWVFGLDFPEVGAARLRDDFGGAFRMACR